MSEKSTEIHSAQPKDLLLSCLVWFTQYFHQPVSAQILTAGLPLDNHLLTLFLFARAAEKGRLSSVTRQKSWEEMLALTAQLPVLLMLKDNKPVVLLKIKKNNTAELLDPEVNMGVVQLSLKQLKKLFTGTVVLVKPVYEFTERSKETWAKNLNNQSLYEKTTPKSWFWQIILKVWPLYIEVLLAALLINLLALAVPLFAMNVYDRVVPNEAIETLWVLSLGVLIVFVFDFTMRILRSYFIDMAGKSVDLQLSAQIFERVLGIRMSSRPDSVGAFSNIIQSFESFRDFITSSTITVLVDLPFVMIFIIIIAIVGGALAWIPLVMVPVIILVGWVIQIPLTALTKTSYQYASEKQANLIEALGGVETIKIMGAESPVQKRWEQVNYLASLAGMKLRFFANINIYFSVFAQQLAYVLVIIWGVYKISAGELTTGGLIACSILTSRALSPMSQVAALLTRYYQTVHALTSLNLVMGLPVERATHRAVIHRPLLKGLIEFHQVGFSYPNQSLPVLNKVSFKILPGEKVGIIGRMGSGKTTIAKLILGLYQPASGLVLMDGIDQHQLDVTELRHHMGYVPQDVTLFYGSIKDNIILGAPYVEDSAVIKAAQIAGVESFTRAHPQGLAMQVGERGTRLSGGQRQCIAIARAILLEPSIMIFDEATNAMDDRTEQWLKNALHQYLQHKTLVLITHKASMLSMVDRLIILEAGQLIADGPKEQILKLLTEGKIKAPSFSNSF